jgi:hypothetical protein
MTITIDADLEARLRAVAAAQGQDVNSYAVAVLQEAAEGHRAGAGEILPMSPAEAVGYWHRNGLLGPFGPEQLDSPELARELRRQAERRDW